MKTPFYCLSLVLTISINAHAVNLRNALRALNSSFKEDGKLMEVYAPKRVTTQVTPGVEEVVQTMRNHEDFAKVEVSRKFAGKSGSQNIEMDYIKQEVDGEPVFAMNNVVWYGYSEHLVQGRPQLLHSGIEKMMSYNKEGTALVSTVHGQSVTLPLRKIVPKKKILYFTTDQVGNERTIQVVVLDHQNEVRIQKFVYQRADENAEFHLKTEGESRLASMAELSELAKNMPSSMKDRFSEADRIAGASKRGARVENPGNR